MLVTNNLWRQHQNLNSRDPHRAKPLIQTVIMRIGISSLRKQGFWSNDVIDDPTIHTHLISTHTHTAPSLRSPRCACGALFTDAQHPAIVVAVGSVRSSRQAKAVQGLGWSSCP